MINRLNNELRKNRIQLAGEMADVQIEIIHKSSITIPTLGFLAGPVHLEPLKT